MNIFYTPGSEILLVHVIKSTVIQTTNLPYILLYIFILNYNLFLAYESRKAKMNCNLGWRKYVAALAGFGFAIILECTLLQKRFVAMPRFFKGGPKFDPLLQIVVDTVGAAQPPIRPYKWHQFLGADGGVSRLYKCHL